MAACTTSKRYNNNQYVSLSTRCSRIKVKVDVEDGTPARLYFFYSYDIADEHPHWKELKDVVAETTTKNKIAEFFILLGPSPPGDMKENVAKIRLPRRPAAHSSVELPHLVYTVRVREYAWVDSGRIKLHSAWETAVYNEATDLAQRLSISGSVGFVSTPTLLTVLKNTWQELFECTDSVTQENEDSTAVHVAVLPRFDEEVLLRMMRVAHSDFESSSALPELASWCLLRGSAPNQGSSVMRVFNALADLIGRSRLVRRLYADNKIAVAGSQDIVEFKLEGAPMPNYAFFFRMPRSFVPEPALVMQLYEKNETGQWTNLTPTPYVTATQIEAAGGDPLRAFRRLSESKHLDIFLELTYEHMLSIHWQSISSLHLKPPTPFSCSEIENYVDRNWWESRFLLHEHN